MTEIRFESGKGTMRLGADGILHLVWARDTTVQLADVKETIDAAKALSGGHSLQLLMEIDGIDTAPEARKYAAKKGAWSAVATVGVTSADRVHGAWMRRHSGVPQAYFTSREEAMEWLARLPSEGDQKV